jgi:hypothetical protein
MSVSQWTDHFRKMSENKLPPGSIHTVRNRGGGPTRSYYRVETSEVSPARQAVDQAAAQVEHRRTYKAGSRTKKATVTRKRPVKRNTTNKTVRRSVNKKTRQKKKKTPKRRVLKTKKKIGRAHV